MQITVTDALDAAAVAPAIFIPEAGAGRKQLVCQNTGENTAYFGWEEATRATAGASQGVPLEAGASIAFGGPELDLRGKLYFICAESETTTINYTQRG